ncbi:hypothetical protein PFISCL1PPCAC_21228, partial [Pristionchus fissidentatus]
QTKKKSGGGRTGRKVHSNNKPVDMAALQDSPSRNLPPPEPMRVSRRGSVIGGKPKAPKKKTKRTKPRTVEDTVGDDDNEGQSQLIQIPEALLLKTSHSMMQQPPSEDHPSREVAGPTKMRRSELIESNQAFIENTIKKGWPAVAAEFQKDHKEMPGTNGATRYTIAFNVPPETDFYDANKVDILGVDPKFIIAAAPTADVESRETFWRMVYDSNVSNIYHLENQAESMEDPFIPWTAGESKDYGKMFVSNKKATATKRDAQAVLEVLPEGCSNSIIVRFAQSIVWPDKVTIESEPRKCILHFVRLLREEKSTVMIIDKTGCGKACMFVMVHSIISLLNTKSLRDVTDVLAKLRQDRWGAIKTEQQYLMVYQATLDYIAVKTPSVKHSEEFKKKLFTLLKAAKQVP